MGEFSLEIAFAQACLFKRVSQIYWLFYSIDKGLLFFSPLMFGWRVGESERKKEVYYPVAVRVDTNGSSWRNGCSASFDISRTTE